MNVIELLPRHDLCLNRLGMTSLLPELKTSVGLVPGFVRGQAIEQGLDMSIAEGVDDPSRRERLEIPDLLPEVLRSGDEMDVVLKDGMTKQNESVLILEKLPGIEENPHSLRLSEDG